MRFKPEEFLVEEITLSGETIRLNEPFQREDSTQEKKWHCRFALQKTLWNTNGALRALARAVHAKPSRFSFAGSKDRNAVTTQLCSAFCVNPKALLNARVKDLKVLGAWKEEEKVRLGDLKGNRFTITLTRENCGAEPDPEKIRGNASKGGYPNAFGSQRFGSVRKNTALVGELLLKGDLEGAVKNFLCYTKGENNGEALKARRRLEKEGDYGSALEYYPKWLKAERLMLASLAEKPSDWARALRRLPRGLQLLFVHAVQSRLFNDELAAAPSGEEGSLVGYETPSLTPFEEEWLEGRGLSRESFRLPHLPELASKGGKRKWFTELHGFELLSEDPVTMRFSLDSGCYATQAIKFLVGLGQ